MNKVEFVGTALKAAKAYSEKGPAQFMLKVEREGTKAHDFIPVKAFGDMRDIALQNIVEGSPVAVTGHMQSGSYEKDGKKIYTLDVVANWLGKPQVETKGGW